MKKLVHSVFRMLFCIFILSLPVKEANAWGHFKLRLVRAKPAAKPAVRKVKQIAKPVPVLIPGQPDEATGDEKQVTVKESIPKEIIVEKSERLKPFSFRHRNRKKEVTNTISKENVSPVIQVVKEVTQMNKTIVPGKDGPFNMLGSILAVLLLVILLVLLFSVLFLIFGVAGVLFLGFLLLLSVVILSTLIFAGVYKLTHWN